MLLEPAPGSLTVFYAKQGRLFLPTKLETVPAAVGEFTTDDHLRQRRHGSLYFTKPFDLFTAANGPWYRLEQSLGVGVEGIIE